MRHVYLHVPFCRRRCSYCDFSIAVRRTVPADAYVEAVRREHEIIRAAGEWDEEPLETLYLGGGTPSTLPPVSIGALVEQFVGNPGAATANSRESTTGKGEGAVEITLEANPDDVTPEAARAWRVGGVSRVSLGVQSFDDRVLAWMHRTHDAAAAAAAVGTLRRAGFENVSLDLIFALPEAVRPDFRADLDRALALEPAHLSIYGLSVEPRTPLARWLSRGALAPTAEQRYAEEFALAHEALTSAGFDHYEVSNYARPGRRSRHNAAYWAARPYAGLGPAAHSLLGGVRRWNLGPWTAYERAIRAGRRPEAEREVLTPEQGRLETVYLGLRTVAGIPRTALPTSAHAVAQQAIRQGWLVADGDRLRATAAGWLRLDEIVTRLTT